jgi:hypothetical protein
MNSASKILNARDKILFEKALKFYFYTRQQDVSKLNSELQHRFSYAGKVAYSLIITFIKEGRLRLEYMDFLNEELKTMRNLKDSLLEPLMIKPHEIDEIEFNQTITITVFDEDSATNLRILYNPDTAEATLRPAK